MLTLVLRNTVGFLKMTFFKIFSSSSWCSDPRSSQLFKLRQEVVVMESRLRNHQLMIRLYSEDLVQTRTELEGKSVTHSSSDDSMICSDMFCKSSVMHF